MICHFCNQDKPEFRKIHVNTYGACKDDDGHVWNTEFSSLWDICFDCYDSRMKRRITSYYNN